MKKIFQINKEIVFRESEDLIYILDVDGNKLRTLNDVASLIWKTLKRNKTLDEIVAVVVSEYDVDVLDAKKDCMSFLEKYEKMGFVRSS